MATHSSTLAWKIPWIEEPGRLQSRGHKELDTTERLHFPSFTANSTLHQCQAQGIPCSPVVKTLHFDCRGSIPSQETKISQASWGSQKSGITLSLLILLSCLMCQATYL